MAGDRIIRYVPAGPTVAAFHRSNAFARFIRGPIGSGKSSAGSVEILRRAGMQPPGPDGIRRFRAAVLRRTFPELRTTTLRTWGDWCPPEYGKLNFDSPIIHRITTGDLDLEVLFLALDREEDARKLLSLELSMAWLDECREMPRHVFDVLTGRLGRYPSRTAGGCPWYGVVGTTNSYDSEHWLYQLEMNPPEGYEFFIQPSGISAEAENKSNLPAGYYERIAAGKDEDYVRVFIQNEIGFVSEGRPVYPMFRDSVHTAREPIEPLDLGLSIGIDFGLTPAAVIGQRHADGRWFILDEFIADDCGIVRFAELLSAYVARTYPLHRVDSVWCDPAGNQRAQTDERTPLEVLRTRTGWPCYPAPDNDINVRREVVINALNRTVDGRPGFTLSPKCAVLRKGFVSGYHYRPVRSSNGQFHEIPHKNQYSHPHDALQYLFLGGGEHSVLLGRNRRNGGSSGPRIADGVDFDVFDPQGSAGTRASSAATVGRYTTQADIDRWRNRGAQSTHRSRVARGSDGGGWGE